MVALAAVLIGTLLVLRGKSPVVSDADLRFTRSNVSSNENGFFVFEKAREELYWPKMPNRKDILDWSSWDGKAADEILAENRKSLEFIDEMFRLPRFQIPEIQSIDENFEYLGDLKNLSRVVLLRALTEFREGKEKEAVDTIGRVARFGHQVEESDGILDHYLAGSAIKMLALKTLREMVGNTTFSYDSIQNLRGGLAQLSANGMGLTNAIKKEYQLQVKLLKEWKRGKVTGMTNPTEYVSAKLITMTLLNQEKTRAKFAKRARFELSCIPHCFHDKPHNSVSVSTNVFTVPQFLSGNVVGEVMVNWLAFSENILVRKCEENVAVSATQAILALKCYKMKYGQLPKSLTDLVPEFLSAIPLDDFDGKPLRYSVEKKIVYSVGADLIDSGGQETNSAGKSLDIPFKILF